MASRVPRSRPATNGCLAACLLARCTGRWRGGSAVALGGAKGTDIGRWFITPVRRVHGTQFAWLRHRLPAVRTRCTSKHGLPTCPDTPLSPHPTCRARHRRCCQGALEGEEGVNLPLLLQGAGQRSTSLCPGLPAWAAPPPMPEALTPASAPARRWFHEGLDSPRQAGRMRRQQQLVSLH